MAFENSTATLIASETGREQSSDQDSENKERAVIVARDETGRVIKSEHPTIVGDNIRGVDQIWHSADQVKCRVGEKLIPLTFDEYLEVLGVNYGDYFKKIKQSDGGSMQQREIFLELHKATIDQRTQRAIKLYERYTQEKAKRDNLQQETALAHSPFFIKIINDLGIDGLSAAAARPRNDFLDEIDEYLVLDPAALASQGEEVGEKIYIGVQRSFKDKKLKSGVEFLPEDLDKGPIFKIFLRENREEYIENSGDRENEESYWQKLLNLRARKAKAAGLSPTEYAKVAAKEGLATVDKVLLGGVESQVAKTLNVLQAIKDQWAQFVMSRDFLELSPGLKKLLEDNYKNINIDKFLEAVQAEHR
ncbi:MAG: hypothetical protein C3F02_00060 [Parcubacteria group bacterium]|nr:MAG: hypothetical protein C3F02_00060 [Parcubacteria group bacterium]